MNWNKAETLLARFYAGACTPQEEAELKQLLSGTDVPPHLKQDGVLLRQMREAATQGTTLSDEALFAKLDATIAKEKPAKKGIRIQVKFLLQAAAAVALLLTGYWAGQSLQPENQQSSQQSTQLAEIRQEVKAMQEMLSRNSPSERIKAAAYAQDLEANAELIQTLIRTMHFDDNVNVRMAAIKALLHFRDQPDVRLALIHSLSIQEDPNVQIQLIDGLVDMDEKEAIPQMRDLLKNEQLQQMVRFRLQEGIGRLI